MIAVLEFFREIFLQLVSAELQEKLYPLKVVFIIISVVLTIYIFYILRHTTWWAAMFSRSIEEFRKYKAAGGTALAARWRRVAKRAERGTSSEMKLAILEADKMLDDVLKRLGFLGETVEERLKSVPQDYITNREALLKAHILRNDIVHDPNYNLSPSQVKEAIEAYETALKELEIV